MNGARLWLRLTLVGALVVLITAGVAGATTFTNSGTITINDDAVASPYPSTMTVSGLSGTITDVNVTLFGLTHPFTHDIAVLLVAAGSLHKVLLMADCGGASAISNVNLTLDDDAANPLPCAGTLSTGSFRSGGVGLPGSCPHPNPLPQPAPLGPYESSLSAINGQNPNGVWFLYVVDDCEDNAGSIASGWSLDITTDAPTAVTTAGLSARTTSQGVLLRWRTGSEADLLGFQVYRSLGHSWQRVSHSLIVAKGSVSGATYRFVDRTAKSGIAYRYRVKAVSRDGTASWFDPVGI